MHQQRWHPALLLPMACGLALLAACGGAAKTSRWDNIDYQREARSRLYEDNDAYYRLPTVVTCGADDDFSNPNCK